jgi:hypothetical protein
MNKLKDAIYRITKKNWDFCTGLIAKHFVKPQENQGFGVVMSEEQYEKMSNMMNTIADETRRREELVSRNLDDLKKIEYIKTYTAFIRDVTTSITALDGIVGCEDVRQKMINSLNEAPSLLELSHAQGENKQAITQVSIHN